MDVSDPKNIQNARFTKRRKLLLERHYQLRQMVGAAAVLIIVVNLTVVASFLWFGLPESGNVPWFELFLLAAVELAMLGLVVFGALKHSHAVAGPIFVLDRELERLGRGDLTGSVQFRKADYFHETAANFNSAVAGLREKVKGLEASVEKMAEAVPEDNQGLLAELEQVRVALAEFKLQPAADSESIGR